MSVIGGGLAGVEAAWLAANHGWRVRLYEMRPNQTTPAHHTDGLAELVCSNSFRGESPLSVAVGLLKEEMARLDSLTMRCAQACRLPAGGSLTVDRERFSAMVTDCIHRHPNIELLRYEVVSLPDSGPVIIATGPLTSSAMARTLKPYTGEDLSFFDAISPVVHADSLDWSHVWRQSRYDRDTNSNINSETGDTGSDTSGKVVGDYLNCGLDEPTYEKFIDALLQAIPKDPPEWENVPYFEGCLPIEVMASRGRDTLRFGPMKPVGLTNPATGRRCHAVLQLRQENLHGTLWSLVGFQTRLAHQDQKDILRLIPGLENARFARLGGMHRNTYVNSPSCLDPRMRLRSLPRVRLAGQMTGVEGYMESASSGMLASLMTVNIHAKPPPPTTAMGALLQHVTHTEHKDNFQPMNVNYGLFPPLDSGLSLGGRRRKAQRRSLMVERAREDFAQWMDNMDNGVANSSDSAACALDSNTNDSMPNLHPTSIAPSAALP